MRPSCQSDQVEPGPRDAQSNKEKLRDQLRTEEEKQISPKPQSYDGRREEKNLYSIK